MLKRIKFVALPVKDQQRALEFWTGKVGFKVFTDQTMGDMRWIELRLPGAETMLVLHKEAEPSATGATPVVSFVADDVKATYAELKERGVEFTQPPTKEHWGEYAVFQDSEGNQIVFSKS